MPRRPKLPPPDLSSDQRRAALDDLKAAMLSPTPYRQKLIDAVAAASAASRHHLLIRLGPAGLECKRASESETAWRPWDGKEL